MHICAHEVPNKGGGGGEGGGYGPRMSTTFKLDVDFRKAVFSVHLWIRTRNP